MKIAVLISGEYRTFGTCRKTMKFLDDPRVDIYFSTWDKTIYKVPKINLYQIENVTEEIIRKDLGKDAVIEIESSSTLFHETRYNSRMIHRWKQGIELIKTNDIKYDYILIIRPDLYFSDYADHSLKFIEDFKDKLGAGWFNPLPPGFLNDVMLLSSAKRMIELFDALTIQEWQTNKNNDWHTWWYSFVINYFSIIEDLGDFARCTFCRYWVKENHSFMDIAQIQEDWSDLMVLQISDNAGRAIVDKNWPANVIIRMDKKWAEKIYDKYTDSNEGNNI